MGASSFNEMELDAIGEIMNISLGASATAVSTMLGTTVNITTPVVSVLTRQEFEFRRLEPAIGVEIDRGPPASSNATIKQMRLILSTAILFSDSILVPR